MWESILKSFYSNLCSCRALRIDILISSVLKTLKVSSGIPWKEHCLSAMDLLLSLSVSRKHNHYVSHLNYTKICLVLILMLRNF